MAILLHVILTLSTALCARVIGTCTPSEVKDDLDKCLEYQSLGTYFQFPIVPAASLSKLCSNSTCLAYCLEYTVIPCQNQDYIYYLGVGRPLMAAYLGFCDQTITSSALSCAEAVPNQSALNAISTFQVTLQSYVDAGTQTNTNICADWLTMLNSLKALINTACSSDTTAIALWTKYLNTLNYACDSSSTPSFYSEYSTTPVEVCAGPVVYAGKILIALCVVLHITLMT